MRDDEKNLYISELEEHAKKTNKELIKVYAKAEAELIDLDGKERLEYLDMLGLKEPTLDVIIKKGFELLNLFSYFTAGPKKLGPGQLKEVQKHPMQQVKFIVILKKDLLKQR